MLPQASSLSCLHRFIIIFIDGAICIIVLKLRMYITIFNFIRYNSMALKTSAFFD